LLLSLRAELRQIFDAIAQTWRHLLTVPGIVIMSAFAGIVVWGPRGTPIFSGWLSSWLGSEPASAALRAQYLSFASGLVLLVLIPWLLIRLRFRQRLSDYGLGLGNVRLGAVFMLLLIAVSIVPFVFASHDPAMSQEYPLLYRGLSLEQKRAAFSWASFLGFELVYACFFFVIEFVFRGYLLFGLRPQFGEYAVIIQMLSYTAWHLTKPTTELVGTPIWGFVVAAVTLRVNSLWYVFAAHWLLNVLLDTLILWRLGVIPGH
jgi:membrane protease YdiL (CAAX protease family)